MLKFRSLLLLQFIGLFAYTSIVVFHHGSNFLAVFFMDVASFTWAGQFDLDFLFMLSFAALWIAWRHKFSVSGLLMAVISLFGGALFLCPYLFYFSTQARGDVVKFLLGEYVNPA